MPICSNHILDGQQTIFPCIAGDFVVGINLPTVEHNGPKITEPCLFILPPNQVLGDYCIDVYKNILGYFLRWDEKPQASKTLADGTVIKYVMGPHPFELSHSDSVILTNAIDAQGNPCNVHEDV